MPFEKKNSSELAQSRGGTPRERVREDPRCAKVYFNHVANEHMLHAIVQ